MADSDEERVLRPSPSGGGGGGAGRGSGQGVFPCPYCDAAPLKTKVILNMHINSQVDEAALEREEKGKEEESPAPAASTAGALGNMTFKFADAGETAGPIKFGGGAASTNGAPAPTAFKFADAAETAGPIKFGGGGSSATTSKPANTGETAGPIKFGGSSGGSSGVVAGSGLPSLNANAPAFTLPRPAAAPEPAKPSLLRVDDDLDDDNPFPVGPTFAASARPTSSPSAPKAAADPATSALAAAVDKSLTTADTAANANADDNNDDWTPAGAMEVEKSVTGLFQTLHKIEVNLAEQQADTNSPLYSAQTFEELNLPEQLLRGVYAMGFQRPSKIQERALPLLLRNGPSGRPNNLIAQSQAGTGKTAAFALCMLGRADETVPAVQALCIAPTRELARQIGDVVVQMAKFTKITVFMAIKEREGAPSSSSGPVRDHIVIGTPGTVSDLLAKRRLNLSQLRVFAVDEADDMLDRQGMGDQTAKIRRQVPDTSQILLFSATYPVEVREYAVKMVPNANTISLKREELALNNIQQFFVRCQGEQEKYSFLSKIYGLLTIGQSIIFCNRKVTCNNLTQHMQREGYTVSTLHGDLLPDERDRVMESFRKGSSKVLIATNVLSRGIDVLQVSLVINFDLPTNENGSADVETYLHRIGRTGRFGRTGCAINFVHDRYSQAQLEEIRRTFGKAISELPSDPEKLDEKLQSIGKA